MTIDYRAELEKAGVALGEPPAKPRGGMDWARELREAGVTPTAEKPRIDFAAELRASGIEPPEPPQPRARAAPKALTGDEEREFRTYTSLYGVRDPDDPRHHYDYRGAFRAGVKPTRWRDLPADDRAEDVRQIRAGKRKAIPPDAYTWPDEHKLPGHEVPPKAVKPKRPPTILRTATGEPATTAAEVFQPPAPQTLEALARVPVETVRKAEAVAQQLQKLGRPPIHIRRATAAVFLKAGAEPEAAESAAGRLVKVEREARLPGVGDVLAALDERERRRAERTRVREQALPKAEAQEPDIREYLEGQVAAGRATPEQSERFVSQYQTTLKALGHLADTERVAAGARYPRYKAARGFAQAQLKLLEAQAKGVGWPARMPFIDAEEAEPYLKTSWRLPLERFAVERFDLPSLHPFTPLELALEERPQAIEEAVAAIPPGAREMIAAPVAFSRGFQYGFMFGLPRVAVAAEVATARVAGKPSIMAPMYEIEAALDKHASAWVTAPAGIAGFGIGMAITGVPGRPRVALSALRDISAERGKAVARQMVFAGVHKRAATWAGIFATRTVAEAKLLNPDITDEDLVRLATISGAQGAAMMYLFPAVKFVGLKATQLPVAQNVLFRVSPRLLSVRELRGRGIWPEVGAYLRTAGREKAVEFLEKTGQVLDRKAARNVLRFRAEERQALAAMPARAKPPMGYNVKTALQIDLSVHPTNATERMFWTFARTEQAKLMRAQVGEAIARQIALVRGGAVAGQGLSTVQQQVLAYLQNRPAITGAVEPGGRSALPSVETMAGESGLAASAIRGATRVATDAAAKDVPYPQAIRLVRSWMGRMGRELGTAPSADAVARMASAITGYAYARQGIAEFDRGMDRLTSAVGIEADQIKEISRAAEPTEGVPVAPEPTEPRAPAEPVAEPVRAEKPHPLIAGIETLDATKPETAGRVLEAYSDWLRQAKEDDRRGLRLKELNEPSVKAVDAAFSALGQEVETGEEGMRAWALPGKEKALRVAIERAKRVRERKGKPAKKRRPVTVKILPARAKTAIKRVKATMKIAPAEDTRYALSGISVEDKGSRIVVTDGRRLWITKGKKGEYGRDGLREVAKDGTIGAIKKDAHFPKWADVIPAEAKDPKKAKATVPVEATLRSVRRAALVTTEESRGVLVLLNPDGSLGFAAQSVEIGTAEIDVQDGYKELGGINPTYLRQQLEWHYAQGDDNVTVWFGHPNKPLVTKGDSGRTTGVLMPIAVEMTAKQIREAARPAAREEPAEAPPAPEAVAEKQPWEMTRDEFLANPPGIGLGVGKTFASEKSAKIFLSQHAKEEYYAGAGWKVVPTGGGRFILRGKSRTERMTPEAHAEAVQVALIDRKPVPPAVLRDYAGEPWADKALAKMEARPAAPEAGMPVEQYEILNSRLQRAWERTFPTEEAARQFLEKKVTSAPGRTQFMVRPVEAPAAAPDKLAELRDMGWEPTREADGLWALRGKDATTGLDVEIGSLDSLDEALARAKESPAVMLPAPPAVLEAVAPVPEAPAEAAARPEARPIPAAEALAKRAVTKPIAPGKRLERAEKALLALASRPGQTVNIPPVAGPRRELVEALVERGLMRRRPNQPAIAEVTPKGRKAVKTGIPVKPPAVEEAGPVTTIPPESQSDASIVIDEFRKWPSQVKPVGEDFWTAVMDASRRFSLPHRYKALRRTVLGHFGFGKGIEVQDVRDALTAVHELGHAFDWMTNGRFFPPSIIKRFEGQGNERTLRAELAAVSRIIRADMWVEGVSEYSKRYVRNHAELMGDFFSLYILDPDLAKAKAPTVFRLMDAKLKGFPEIRKTVDELRRVRYEGPTLPPIAARIRDQFPLRAPLQPLMLTEALNDSLDYATQAQRLGMVAGRQYRALMHRAATHAQRIKQLVPDAERRADLVVLAEEGKKNPKTGKTHAQIEADLTGDEAKALRIYRAYQELARQTVNKYLRGADIAEYIKWIENYFVHIYHRSLADAQKAVITRWAKRSPQARKRVLPTLDVAVEAGLMPRTLDLAEGLEIWAAVNYRVSTNLALLRILPQIENEDGVSIVQAPKDFPEWPTVDYWPIRKIYARPLKGRGVLLWEGRVAVDPRVKSFIDALFLPLPTARGAWYSKPARALQGLNAVWKGFKLTILTLFHHQAEFFSSIGALGPRALPFVGGYWGKRAFAFGKVRPALGFLPRLPAHIGVLAAGRELENTPDFMEDYLLHGGQVGFITTEGRNTLERMLRTAENFLSNVIEERPAAGVPVWGLYMPTKAARAFYTWSQHFLWDNVQRAKLVCYYQIVQDGVKHAPDLSPDEIKDIAIKYINDNFGGQEWLNGCLKNPQFRWGLSQLFMSLDWTWSQVKTVGYPVRFGWGARTKAERRFMRKIGRHHWFWYTLGIFGFTQLASYALNRRFSWDNEIGQRWNVEWTGIWRELPWNSGTIGQSWEERGDKARRYFGMGKAGRELIRWVDAPIRAFGNKLSPVARFLFEQTTGSAPGSPFQKPWVREDISLYDNVYARFGHALSQFRPYSFSGNNAFLAFPSRKGMTRWRAVRSYEHVFRAQAEIAGGGLRANLQKLYGILDKNHPRLMREVGEACKLNGVDAEKARSAAMSGVRRKFYRQFWIACRTADVREANRTARALSALGITMRGAVQSLRTREELISPEARERARRALEKVQLPER